MRYLIESKLNGGLWTITRKKDGATLCLQGDDAIAFTNVFPTLMVSQLEDYIDSNYDDLFSVDESEAVTNGHKPLSADDVTDELVDKIMNAAKQYHSTASRTGTVTIEISGGCLTDVSGLPEGWNYELIDHDERNSLVQELSKERCVELLAPTGLTFDINDPVEVLRCAVEQAVYDEAIDPSDIE